MCAAIDSDNGGTPSFLNRDAVFSESYNGRYKRIHSFKYTETFAPKFTFFKSDFSNFEIDEVRIVLKWLTSKDTTALLETYYDDSNVVSWASIGGFVDLQTYKLANNRTIAITAVWDSISPFALSDLYTVTRTITSTGTITINIDTDDNKPVYPRITIEHNNVSVINIPAETPLSNILDMVDYVENTAYYNGSMYYWKTSEPVWRSAPTIPNYEGWVVEDVTRAYTDGDTYAKNTFYHYTDGNMYYWIDPYSFHSSDQNPNLKTTSVKIINQHYDFFNQADYRTKMIVKNNTLTEKITVDCANKIVSSDRTGRIFGDDFIDWHWLELHDGKNDITIEGNCRVTIEYRELRKIGEY
jgi:hypothetical protein